MSKFSYQLFLPKRRNSFDRMAYSPRSGGSGGFKGPKKFGNSAPPWAAKGGSRGFGGGDREKPQMYPTTCAACGNRCEVPFRPNGKKPVYCSNCFVRDEEGGAAPKRYEERSSGRPQFEDRRPSSLTPGFGKDESMEMLKKINAKLDTILKALGNGNTF